MATQPTIASLTSQLNHLATHGAGKDTRFSTEACTTYVTHIQNHHTEMCEHYRMAQTTCANYGNVGNLGSANTTKANLVKDLHAFLDTLDQYIKYLDNMKTAVTSSHTRLQHQDRLA
jgi:hypothetical protein